MPEFSYTDLLPLGPDTTEYRLVTEAGVAHAKCVRPRIPGGGAAGTDAC